MKKLGNKRLKNERKRWSRRKLKLRSILDVRIKMTNEPSYFIIWDETSMVQTWLLSILFMGVNQLIWSNKKQRKKLLCLKIQNLRLMNLKVKLKETMNWRNLIMKNQKHLSLKRIQLIVLIWIKFANLMEMRLFDQKANI